MKICIIIPVYNHEAAIIQVLTQLKPYELPVILVNDGSSPMCAQVLRDCVVHEPGRLILVERKVNGGKGAAVMDGVHHALTLGFTHAIQLDADGQHNSADIPQFLASGRQHPDALILGRPVFTADAPKGRVYGRYLTNIWIWINTLSFAIGDGMCGFRWYPLAAVKHLSHNVCLTKRMDFDIEIAVRLYWQGLTVINIDTVVNYPYDGVSHFRLWRDNLMISKIHARLFFGMSGRFWPLLKRHFA